MPAGAQTFGTRLFARRGAVTYVMRRLHFFLFAADVLALLGAAAVPYLILDLPLTPEQRLPYLWCTCVVVAAYGLIGFLRRFYDWRMVRAQLRKPLTVWSGVALAFSLPLVFAFAVGGSIPFSREWWGLWLLIYCGYIVVSRVGLTYLAAHARTISAVRRAVIVGAGENGRDALDHLRKFDDVGIEVVGFLDDRTERIPDSYDGVPVRGGTELAETLVANGDADLVIIALPWQASDRINALVAQLSRWPADIFVAPGRLGLMYSDRPRYRLGGMPLLSMKDKPISEWAAVMKRVEDLALAIPAILLLSPLLLAVAAAIKLDSKGPVFFKQRRYGFNNNLIEVFKFRSMYTDKTDMAGAQLTLRNDPRITRVGAFIRKTSIDELPQLFNVLLGDMSVVGPRPHAVEAKAGELLYHEAVDGYASRHRVKPGITGWAQCNGWRGETDTQHKIVKRVEHDLYYIENWSVLFDMLIIVKTATSLMLKRHEVF
jgi:Undecaprenyl-phosphate glucose phosphotransferase